VRALIASKTTVGVDAIAMRDHFGVVVGVSFGGGTRGGVWLLVSTASAALCIRCSVYVLEALTMGSQRIGTRFCAPMLVISFVSWWLVARLVPSHVFEPHLKLLSISSTLHLPTASYNFSQ
jgi:hypothetical protein